MSSNLSEISMTDTVDFFFGVYLLYSLHPKYRGRTYIGFTVDPNRRINQHNKGCHSGGARRTNNRGPWEMVLIVHGFPSDISALRFEWAWQHPKRSRRLRCVQRKKPRENQFQYSLRILQEMLRIGPWNKLPLTVRWLKEDFFQEFPADRCPPMHMPIAMGPVHPRKVDCPGQSVVEDTRAPSVSPSICHLCHHAVATEDRVQCVAPECSCSTHILCLATHFLGNETDNILPIEGVCPLCKKNILWGDIILKKKILNEKDEK